MAENKELAVVYEVDGSQVKLTQSIVQNYIVGANNPKITMQEFKFFTELCRARGLNPFLKEVYCIKYGNEPAAIVVGKDAFIKRANADPDFDGMETGILIVDKNGVLVERPGTFKLSDEKLVGGWAKVYRKSRNKPTYVSVAFDEVAGKKKDGSLNSNWAKQPATMVEKVAYVRALRLTFVEKLGGMYDEDEMGVVTQVDPVYVHEQAQISQQSSEPQFDDEELNMDELPA